MASTTGVPRPVQPDTQSSNPLQRAWREDRLDLPSILHAGGNENASTARYDLEEGITRRSPPTKAQKRGRQNSLKHVKNSTEVLRQRSIKRNNPDTPESNGSTREGRSFAVANVGGNGKIYLRYVRFIQLHLSLAVMSSIKLDH